MNPTNVPTVKAKNLKARIVIELPLREADPAIFESYEPQDMAKIYKGQLEENLLEELEDSYEQDTMDLTVTVEVVD